MEPEVEVKSAVVAPEKDANDHEMKDVKEVKDTKDSKKKPALVVERDKTCPFLLRMFVRDNNHHRTEDFSVEKQPFGDELQAYTWKDATLKELAALVKEVNPDAKAKDVKMSFRMIFFDLDGRPRSKDLGEVANASKGPDDGKSLDDIRFVIGDYIDVAIHQEGKRFSAERKDSRRDRDDRGGRDNRDNRDSRERREAPRELDWEKAKERPKEYDRNRGGRRDRGRR